MLSPTSIVVPAPCTAAVAVTESRCSGGTRIGVVQLAVAALVSFLLTIGPHVQGNSVTSADTFHLEPTAMVLLLSLAVAGPVTIGSGAVVLQRYAGERR